MVIEPRTRGFICLTAHPTGCEKNVIDQIQYVKSKGQLEGPKNVLVIGASTGFGLSSRISSAFGSGASTIGVFFEKGPTAGRPASPGWYNSAAFEEQAKKEGLYAKSVNGDAFSNEIKKQTLDLIKEDLGKIDLVVYSLASPVRVHPTTGTKHKSVLKPVGTTYSSKTVDFHTGNISEVSIEACNDEEIENTVAVMGGEDWEMWIDALSKEDLLSEDFKTVAYSYVGPKITEAVYRKGTIGCAKDHLEATAHAMTDKYKSLGGQAFVSVNKALVTQASSAIPVIPLYISLLFKVMKEAGNHEGCVEQIDRLFRERMYGGSLDLDDKGRIRIDDWEMGEEIQSKVAELWTKVSTDNLADIGDLKGYSDDFFSLFGFGLEGIDYQAEVDEMVQVPSLS